MNKFKQYDVDYDFILKLFFNSVIKDLSEYRSRCDMSEQSAVSDTLSRFNMMSQDSRKYLAENKIYGDSAGLGGLFLIQGKGGHHDVWRYPLVMNVLKHLVEYYKIPTSKCYKDALDKELKNYFVTYEPSVLRQIQYTLMSPGRMMFHLTKQKTK